MKKVWGDRADHGVSRGRVTTRVDPKILATYPPADISIERIGDLLGLIAATIPAHPSVGVNLKERTR